MRDLLYHKKVRQITLCIGALLTILLFLLTQMYYLGGMVFFQKYPGILYFGIFVALIPVFRVYKEARFQLFFLFWLWMVGSSIYMGNDLLSAMGHSIPRMWYIYLTGFLVAYLLPGKQRKLWFRVLLACGLLVFTAYSAYALKNATLALLYPDFLSDKYHGLFQNGRLVAYGNANLAGMVAGVELLVMLYFIILTGAWKKYRAANLLLIPLFLFAMLMVSLIRSRSAMIGCGIAAGFIGGIYAWEKIFSRDGALQKAGKTLCVFLLVTVLFTACTVIPKYGYDKGLENYAQFHSEERSAEQVADTLTPYALDYSLDNLTDRTLIWEATIRQMNEKPITWIMGTTAQTCHLNEIYAVYENRPERAMPHPHNVYLDAIFHYGIVGSWLLLCFLLYIGRDTVRLLRSKEALFSDKCTVMFLIFPLVFGMTEVLPLPIGMPFVPSYLFFITAGYICGLVKEKEGDVNETTNP